MRTHQIIAKVTPEFHALVSRYALEQGVSASDVIRNAVRKYLAKELGKEVDIAFIGRKDVENADSQLHAP